MNFPKDVEMYIGKLSFDDKFESVKEELLRRTWDIRQSRYELKYLCAADKVRKCNWCGRNWCIWFDNHPYAKCDNCILMED